MIKIEKAEDISQEYLQCSSCLKSNGDIKMFRLIIGKNSYQTSTIKLCEACLEKLEKEIKEKLS